MITKGLQAGDRVLVEGNDKVAAGDTVKPVEVQPAVVQDNTTQSFEGAA